jgi:hypothetical protein
VKPTGRDRGPAFDRLIAGGLAREVDASGNACPDADLLAGWFDHTLSAIESERIEAHAAGCACCQQLLAALARSEPVVVRAAPVPRSARPWHWHWRWLAPLATAMLVVIVGTRTLRAPGPVMVTGPTPPAQTPAATTAGLRPSDYGAASPEGSPPHYGVARPQPAQREAKKVALAPPPPALAAGAASGALEAQQTSADMARRVEVRGAEKAVPPPPPPPVPAMAESVAGRAPRQGFGTLNVRQASVAASMIAGSAVAWRFGQDGAIEKSSDRGQTWERQSSGVTTALADASAPSDQVCWIVGANGVVVRTTDGRTWERLNSPTDADLVAVHAWSEASATITASDRSVYETTDGGKSWRRL